MSGMLGQHRKIASELVGCSRAGLRGVEGCALDFIRPYSHCEEFGVHFEWVESHCRALSSGVT
jgi:hypothetical protein